MTDQSPEVMLRGALEGFVFSAEPIEKRNGRDHWSRDALHFRVSIVAPKNRASWTGEYSAGSAFPIMAAQKAANGSDADWIAFRKRVARVSGSYGFGPGRADVRKLSMFGNRTLHDAALISALRKTYRPEVVDVVSALFSDASFVSELTSFREYCDEMGSDWENPADALEAFEACKRAARFLRLSFGDRFDSLAELAAEL